MSRPFIHLGRCSVRTKFIPYVFLAASLSMIVKLQTGVSSEKPLLEQCLMAEQRCLVNAGWNKNILHFINEKRVDHFNSSSRIKSAQHKRVSCFLQHFHQQQQH